MGRVRITQPFVLLALAALMAPRIEASRTSVWESNPPSSLTTTKTDAAPALASLAPAAAAEVEITEAPRLDLGDVLLVESELEHEDRFGLGPLDLLGSAPLRGPPPSYPETRVGGFELLPPFRVGASASLSLWSRQACGFSCREVASDSRYDPWGLESGATFGAIDKRDRGYVAPPAPPLTPQQKAAAQQALIGCSVVAGGVGAGVVASPSLVGAIAAFGAAWEGGPDCILGAIGFFSGENRESPLTEARRGAVYSDLKSAGVEITPAVGEEAEEAVARMQAASVTAFAGFGAMAPSPGVAPLRTDGPTMPRLPRPGRGNQAAFSRTAEDVVSESLGIERNPLGVGGDTVPGSGPGGVRYPEFRVHGPEGSLATRHSLVEVKVSRNAIARSGLSARDRAQLRDYVAHVRELRASGGLADAKVELFTNHTKPTRGEFRRYIQEGLLEWKPIPAP